MVYQHYLRVTFSPQQRPRLKILLIDLTGIRRGRLRDGVGRPVPERTHLPSGRCQLGHRTALPSTLSDDSGFRSDDSDSEFRGPSRNAKRFRLPIVAVAGLRQSGLVLRCKFTTFIMFTTFTSFIT
jgi:hypothetical protein